MEDTNALVAGALMYAVLHPPNFAAQAAAQMRPELRKRAFMLFDGEPPGETVFTVNKAGRAVGVEPGMTRLQAESFPDVVAVRRNRASEGAAYAALHAVACKFSPRIESIDAEPGTFALDIRGMTTMYGDTKKLAERLRQSAMAAGFLVNVATAQNANAAACIAYGKTGVSVVPPGREANALQDLPLTVLRAPAHEEIFETWGIRTCGELAAIAETDLIARIGQEGKRLHSLARGAWPHLMRPIEPDFEAGLVERVELEHPVEILESLLFLLSRMTDALLERVKTKALAIASLRTVLTLTGGKKHERTVRPALPLQDTATLLKLLQLDLEMHPPEAAIIGLELRAQSAEPYRAQQGLFLPQAPEPGRLEVLLARLRKLLGEEYVGSPELLDDQRPNAFRVTTFKPPPPARSQAPDRSTPTALRVCRPPRAVSVSVAGNAPARVYWDGLAYTVRDVAGPWRVSGQWWSEANWCREEWDVRLAAGTSERLCRIAFDPKSQGWYVQGTYD